MPNTSEVNAIKIWMIACTLMVCGSLIEYGVILCIMFNKRSLRKILNYTAKNRCHCKHEGNCSKRSIRIPGRNDNERLFVVSQNTTDCKTESNVNNKKEEEELNSHDLTYDITLEMVDAVSLFMFPTVFLLFFVVYLYLYQN